MQQAALEVLVGRLRNQQLQQQVQDAEDQMPESTQRLQLASGRSQVSDLRVAKALALR